ncbi:hypothetical protein EWM62_06300 [Mucilaginibacter terrigena]|uniref:DUF4157 domain-containing protein n=1 Tax=Mucilaginibacter terrigena TaxID=2492395 RepID=A0A4Q5LQ42_9SPHI|nr:PD40 domain-containing protein [Mucilaginibacter terrigena]RYU91547.1 hypothetical protein EWM62_06300 [Mucilaginibacter terrigena]
MKRLLLLLLIFTATLTKAQQFGGNPPSIKWKQVNTPAARVIFSQGMDSVAQRVAQTIARLNSVIQPTIGFKQKQVSIVLQNQTTISNAYVGLAPFRSEFYLTAGQNSFDVGSLPWPGQLAIHEFRHVQQYNNFNVGLSRGLRVLFGEGGQALGNALSVPDWFFEGDAVYNETLVSEQGRGRLPYFFNGFRALWAAGKGYSWMKLRNGSYLDYTPNHYPLGYMMVAYGREKYGNTFWKDVTHDAAAFNTGFYPLQGAIKRHAGVDYTTFRNAAFNHFKQVFKADAKDESPNAKRRHFTGDEEYPAYVNDSTLIYLRSSYNQIPQFVIKTGDSERAIAVQGITTDNYFSYQDGKIIYAAYRPDLRWGYRNYSELVVIDINTGKEHRITRKTKYFAPAFSADGKTIVAVQNASTGKSELHLLNAENGKLLTALPNTAGLFYTYPKFYGDGKIISAVRNFKGEMSLALIDITSGATKYLLLFSFEPIAFPQVQGDKVYFTKTAGLNDRLFVLDLASNQLAEVQAAVQNSAIGAYQPAISQNKIAWTGFTASGYRLQEYNNTDVKLIPVSNSQGFSALPDLNISVLKKDSAANLLASVKTDSLPVTNYSKLHGLFNFHSIFPSLDDPNYSLQLVGENLLNTFQSQLTFTYNRDEGYKQIGYEAAYGAFFPYLLAGADYTFDRRGLYKGTRIYFNETDIHAGLQVPLNLSVGKYSRSLSFSSSFYYSRNTFQEAFRSTFRDSYYTYLSNSIRFSNQTQQARQHINPRFAQSISINYKKSVSGREANQFLSTGTFYFPGLLPNHSLAISGAYQHRGQNNGIGFSNDFPFSHGYTAESLDNMNKFAASYHFPIAYPDAGAANLVYFMRIRGNIFYDQTHATESEFFANKSALKANFRSAGAAIFFDTKWFNQASISFGIRYSRLLDDDLFGGNGRNRVELVLPVAIF